MRELLWLVSTDGDKIFNITEQTKIQITPSSECFRIDVYNGEKFSGTVGYFEDRSLALTTMATIANWLGEIDKPSTTFALVNEETLKAMIEQQRANIQFSKGSESKKKGVFGKKPKN